MKSDNGTMQSASETQLMIKAASATGGLSRDAVMSVESLARGLDESKPRLEDVIANIEPGDEGELRQLRKLSESVKNASYLD
ncbi:MAG: hypothetical protein VYC82_08700 [Verrucomicrobiota bacterium]|nr:hypothetical protein [Verrucomicrobiota bacterium]